MNNNQGVFRDPIWQFIGVIVSIVAIFMTFLTLSSSAQGITLVMVVILFILLIFVFTRRKFPLPLLTILYYFTGCIWWGLISGLTYHQVPFFRENFGLSAPGVVYAKSDFGFDLLLIAYVLLFCGVFTLVCTYVADRRLDLVLASLLSCIFFIYISVSQLYLANFISIKVLGLDWFWPKTALGTVVSVFGYLGLVLFLTSPFRRNRHAHSSDRKITEKFIF